MKLRLALQAATAGLCLISLPASAATPTGSTPGKAIAVGLAIPIAGSDVPRTSLARFPAHGRAVLVDASAARLYMVEDGEIRDSMRVIVGKPSSATPELRSTLYYATVNPYWNVPVDLAQSLIAPNVIEQGRTYLEDRGYEVVTAFRKDADVLDPASVDWQAVADGRQTVHVRQRPGPANSMGQVKFGLAEGGGIYLHDTPRKALFEESDRQLSNGCIRLEDADRLADWLMSRDLPLGAGAPEQHLALPTAVPIVISYAPKLQSLAALR